MHFEMSPRGQVRPRDPVADYLLEEEEQSTRTAWHDHGGGVNLLQPNGPPWYDDITGAELDPKQVDAGMQKERNSLEEFWVKDDVLQSDYPGVPVINSRWVLGQKTPTEVRARVVVQQVNKGSWDDTYAATPTASATRILAAYASMMKYPLVPGDISTAFLHAKIPDGETILVRPLITDRKPGVVWKLRQALYGLRKAPRWFQEHLSSTLEREGFVRL